ncbi:MAG: MAPEG family protein [Steroidobacteraceae bacterium]|nr:MAPEG family protein [Steroidobacteraceae bacterium]MDW8258276.1 MAPEG family protein [Gammaproteobacteria bacterium]
MALVWFVVMLALLEYYWFSLQVGAARGRWKIAAPAVTGHPDFERVYRVQMNTLEQLIVFIPAILAFAEFVSTIWAAALGLIFVIGRAIYAIGYRRAAEKRGLGFVISALPLLALLLGALIGSGQRAWTALGGP